MSDLGTTFLVTVTAGIPLSTATLIGIWRTFGIRRR